ncbi:hypothetical protein DENSPDRAFT_584290 [Dentipellis sp. KUC8613]|nr:hypothetical protein DENSPDRAFT_584290 [Dentipellis sp. KUC8613]
MWCSPRSQLPMLIWKMNERPEPARLLDAPLLRTEEVDEHRKQVAAEPHEGLVLLLPGGLVLIVTRNHRLRSKYGGGDGKSCQERQS